MAILILLVRIATNGTFDEIALQWAPRSRAILTAGELAIAGLALVLAIAVGLFPSRRSYAASGLAAAATLSLAVALSIHHDSAVLVAVLAVGVAGLSIVGWRDSGTPTPPA